MLLVLALGGGFVVGWNGSFDKDCVGKDRSLLERLPRQSTDDSGDCMRRVLVGEGIERLKTASLIGEDEIVASAHLYNFDCVLAAFAVFFNFLVAGCLNFANERKARLLWRRKRVKDLLGLSAACLSVSVISLRVLLAWPLGLLAKDAKERLTYLVDAGSHWFACNAMVTLFVVFGVALLTYNLDAFVSEESAADRIVMKPKELMAFVLAIFSPALTGQVLSFLKVL